MKKSINTGQVINIVLGTMCFFGMLFGVAMHDWVVAGINAVALVLNIVSFAANQEEDI